MEITVPECPVVEVFKTNVSQPADAIRLVRIIEQQFSGVQANFDLEDCDRILRVEGCVAKPQMILDVLSVYGFEAEILD